MEPGIAITRNHLTIPGVIHVSDGIELRRVSAANCAELYAAIDRNRERLRTWLPWVTNTFQLSDLIEFVRQREIDNTERVSLTTNIWFHGKLCGAIGLHAID